MASRLIEIIVHRSIVEQKATVGFPCQVEKHFYSTTTTSIRTPSHALNLTSHCCSFASLLLLLHNNNNHNIPHTTDDTIPFGTRRNVYEVHHEWACHSMWPVQITSDEAKRTTVGTADFGTTRPYSASVFNVSGMSYGAISDNAILALNGGAQRAHCFQNTGEGGVSRFHRQGGGDLVWNIGTGCFGCGSGTGEKRVFEPTMFQETLEKANGQIKMVEIKLSQGAKPGAGGLLPRVKITKEIAEARRLAFPPTVDCHSPPRHASFNNAYELVEFIARVRELSGGLPVGIKMCVGEPREIAVLCKAMLDIGNGPDFITVDGAEGGTGAAPAELSDSVGQPLEEGLVLVRNLLIGCGLRNKVKLNASGRITSGFSIVRTLALGADYTSAARAFMMSIGCIQALKCNTNKCPTGIATQDKDLMYGLDPTLKSTRGKLILNML
jgi:glutamate synthase domain-containing protein 2